MVILYLCWKCCKSESRILGLALRFLFAASASSFFLNDLSLEISSVWIPGYA